MRVRFLLANDYCEYQRFKESKLLFLHFKKSKQEENSFSKQFWKIGMISFKFFERYIFLEHKKNILLTHYGHCK